MQRTCMNCIHENVKILRYLNCVTLGDNSKIGFRYTIKQILNFNCSFVVWSNCYKLSITICKTITSKIKIVINACFNLINNPCDKITCMVSSYRTVRVYSYGPTVRVWSDRTSIRIRSGPYAYGQNTHMVWNIYIYVRLLDNLPYTAWKLCIKKWWLSWDV